MTKERHKLIPASHLILLKKNKILLIRRFNTNYENGKYSLVAGHVELNESFTDCIIREAKEESNIEIERKNLKVIHIMNLNYSPENQRVSAFFICKKWSGKLQNLEPNKCDKFLWTSIKKLPKNTIPYIKQAIEQVLIKKSFYSEWGY